MFGSLGGPEVILLFVVALLLFGPRRLPEIGRTLGKAMADFRRATNEFKTSLEREVELDSLKETRRVLEETPRPDTVARGVIREIAAAAEAPADPEKPARPAGSSSSDGGTDTVH